MLETSDPFFDEEMRSMTTQREKGFTLIEIIVVVAIMAIIGASLVPQFRLMALRSRLKVDVQSVKVLQQQIDTYEQEYSKMPDNNPEHMVSLLVQEGYLNEKYIDAPRFTLHLETVGASVSYDAQAEQVKLKVNPNAFDAYQNTQERSQWITSS